MRKSLVHLLGLLVAGISCLTLPAQGAENSAPPPLPEVVQIAPRFPQPSAVPAIATPAPAVAPLALPGGRLMMVPASTNRPPRPAFFDLADGDRVLFLGDTLMERENKYGYLEHRLTARFPNRNITFRNLAWSADLPNGVSRASFDWVKGEGEWFRQLQEQIRSVSPTVAFVGYGMAASFDGVAGLPKFRADLERLVEFLASLNKEKPVRIVLVSPIYHEKLPPPLPDSTEHNKVLEQYTAAISDLAAARKLRFINLFKGLGNGPTRFLTPFTDNGIHLNAYGYASAAQIFEMELGWDQSTWRISILPDGSLRQGVYGMTATNYSRTSSSGKFTVTADIIQDPPIEGMPGKAAPFSSPCRVQLQQLDEGNYTMRMNGEDLFTAPKKDFSNAVAITNGPVMAESEALRQAILRKNELFFYRWRPQNQTYLFGFRRHEQGQNAREIAQFDPLIAEAEKAIAEARKPKPIVAEVFAAGRVNAAKQPTPPVPAKPAASVASVPPATAVSRPSTPQKLPEFEIDPAFEISLYAEDPQLAKPIQMNFDKDGKLWVASSEVYPQIQPGQKANDKIIVIEDTDGDGKADKSTVFADGLLIPTGVMPGNGGVYVGNSTELLFFRDTNGDGKADEKKVLLSSFGTEDTHHIVHTLRWGFDGSLNFNQSIYIHTHIETPYGVERLNSGGLWNYQPKSGKLGVFLRGFCNPWGQVQDKWGQSFVTDGAGFQGISYGVPGAMYFTYAGGRRILDSISPGNYPKFAGLETIASEQFPDDWQGSLVTCDFRAHRIVHFGVSEEGAGYATRELPDLLRTTNVTFRPIDVKMGPDGALYIADWSNPIIQHGEVDFRDPRRDHEHGRIWRVTAKNRPLVKFEKGNLTPTMTLLQQTMSSNLWTQQRARRIIAERPERSAGDLILWSQKQTNELALLNALWCHQSLNQTDIPLLTRMLRAQDYHVRAASVRILASWMDGMPNAQELLAELVKDPHPRVRVEAVRALSLIPNLRSAELVLSVTDQPMDKFLDYAVWLSINDLAQPWLEGLRSGAWKADGREKQLEYALKAIEPGLAATVLNQLPQAKQIARNGEGPWIELIGQAGDNTSLAALFKAATTGGLEDAATARAFDTIAAAARSRGLRPQADFNALAPLLENGAEVVRAAAARLSGAWKLANTIPALEKAAGSDGSPATLRTAAIQGLREIGGGGSAAGLARLSAATNKLEVRVQAAAALAINDFSRALPLVVGVLKDLKDENSATDFWRGLLAVRGAGARLATTLTKEKVQLDAATARAGLRVAREGSRNEEALVVALGTMAGVEASNGLSDADLKRLATDALSQGDAARGEQVYRRANLACVNCHAIGGAGGKVGPDLTSIGASAQADYLVESVLYPSRKIKEGFHALQVQTKDGEDLSGILVRENANELVLRDAGNHEVSINKGQIQARQTGGSLMPSGLIDALPRGEQLDLFKFLAQLGKAGSYDASKGGVARVWKLMAYKHTMEQQTGDEKLAVSDLSERGWNQVYSQVNGLLARADMQPTIAADKFSGVTGLYTATRIQVSRQTTAKFTLVGSGVQTLWVAGQSVPVSDKFSVKLAPGTYTVLLRLDPKKLPDGLKLSSGDVNFLLN